jgi:HK97 family phage major capsid protein
MLTPREKRAKAAELRAKAQAIYDAKKASDALDFTEDELRQYDGFMTEAERLANEADSDEARDKRMNDLDAKLKGRDKVDDPLPHQDKKNKKHRYSLLKALRQMSSRGIEPLDGIELEVSQAIAKRTKRSPSGFFMPIDLDGAAGEEDRDDDDFERRDLTTSTGAGAKPTDTQRGTFIELLRNATLARTLGVRMMFDMVGDFAIPKQTAGGTAYWVTEGNAPTESNQTLGQLLFQPSTIGAFSDISRKFLIQSSIDAEQFVREDLATVLAIELDRVTFNGSGSGAEPEGIIPNANVNIVAIGTDGGAITYAKLLEMESVLATQNAPNGSVAFVSNPAVRGKMKSVARFANTDTPIWEDTEVIGYPAYASNQIPANLSKGSASGTLSAAILGSWSQAIWAFWTGIDVLVDPITGGTAGTVRIIMLQDADFQIRQPKAFSVIKDILPSA